MMMIGKGKINLKHKFEKGIIGTTANNPCMDFF